MYLRMLLHLYNSADTTNLNEKHNSLSTCAKSDPRSGGVGGKVQWRSSLETVDLNVLLLDNALLRQHLVHPLAVVALQLDDLAELLVLNDGAVAAELLQHAPWR